jgi:hypothetical protein
MPKPKLRHTEIAQLQDLQTALSLAADSVEAARVYAREVQASADSQIEAHRQVMQKHLDRKDLRPHANFKPQPKNIWTVAFNSETYSLGPLDPIPMDDDEPRFWWKEPDGTLHPVRSMFMALVAVVQHYCNEHHDQKDAQELVMATSEPRVQHTVTVERRNVT